MVTGIGNRLHKPGRNGDNIACAHHLIIHTIDMRYTLTFKQDVSFDCAYNFVTFGCDTGLYPCACNRRIRSIRRIQQLEDMTALIGEIFIGCIMMTYCRWFAH